MNRNDSAGDRVILREDPLAPSATGLAGRLKRLGFCIALAAEEGELCRQLDRGQGPQALLLNTALSAGEIAATLKFAGDAIRKGRVTPLAVGATPGLAAREALARGSLTLAALDPLDDATLRFQVNRAFLTTREAGQARREVRVPWEAPVAFLSEGRERRAALYNFSRHGAFLETVRPVQPGSAVEFSLPLPLGTSRIRGEVVHTNAPGNLRRPRAPVGIGVRFEPLPEADLAELDAAVANRCAALLL
ncbi:MAG: PilZ domain-containing protein [Deltaproteobacteria bacterium]|nr:PilZ domain-containing protein [Deltaproteobacteria bacterium]MBW2393898.1 PilZ domain-containing protein [Deltaproteobacteria bacterium]